MWMHALPKDVRTDEAASAGCGPMICGSVCNFISETARCVLGRTLYNLSNLRTARTHHRNFLRVISDEQRWDTAMTNKRVATTGTKIGDKRMLLQQQELHSMTVSGLSQLDSTLSLALSVPSQNTCCWKSNACPGGRNYVSRRAR